MPDPRVHAPASYPRPTRTALLGVIAALASAGAAAAAPAPPPDDRAPSATRAPTGPDMSARRVPGSGPAPVRAMVGVASAIRAGIATDGTPLVPRGRWGNQPVLESSLLAEINRMRELRKIPPLTPAPILDRPARGHARFLAVARGGKLTHEDARGRPFHRRLVEAGWRARARMSENLAAINACRPQDPRLIVRRWMGSPPHRANLLDRKVTHVGVGVVSTTGCAMTVYTADFGN